MPQSSPAYAVGRVRVLENTLIGQNQLERLTGVQTVEELARALGELNWGEVRTRADIERMCDRRMKDTARLVREITSDQALTDCFLIQYDALNLKILFKSKVLGERYRALSALGVLDEEKLMRAVDENNYRDLPAELREAMEDIEKRSAVKMDPLYVDAQLDKATYRYIQNRMASCSDETIKTYFVCKAELSNLMIALRTAAMGRGAEFARGLFVPGGTLSLDALVDLVDKPDRLWDLVRYRPYGQSLSSAIKTGDMAAIERAGEDYLMSLFRKHRYEPTSILPLIGYLLARGRESQAIRLIVTAKAAHVGQDKIMSRLRALY